MQPWALEKGDSVVHLIFGLGNPGPEYARTRHNIGFMVVDALARQAGISLSRFRFRALTGEGQVAGQKVLLAMPQTFMNLSGQSAGEALRFYQGAVEDVVVIHDEADLPFGAVRIKKGGGHAGHNGLRSLIDVLGSPEFIRIRVGIGRPPGRQPMVDYVLQPFSSTEVERLWEVTGAGTAAVEAILTDGLAKAMGRINAVK